MHDAIRSMLDRYSCENHDERVHALRGILQEVALLGLWRSKFFEHAAFYGGTALRLLYGLDRYSEDSLTNPNKFDGDWNRSFELTASTARGVAVMLHGLTDSPYSMLPTAQSAVGAGYNVIVPRMAGHGFAVGGMLQARWEDWAAITRIAVRRAMEIREADQPFLMVGYSNAIR